jgi:PAS domain S-box-containing protein
MSSRKSQSSRVAPAARSDHAARRGAVANGRALRTAGGALPAKPATLSGGAAGKTSVEPALTVDEYRQLFDSAPVFWMVLDGNGVILDINAAACAALAARRDFVVGMPLLIWTHTGSRAGAIEHFRRCRASDEPVESELQLQPRGNQAAPLLVRLNSRRVDLRGQALFATIATDISEKQGLDMALLAAERQRDLAEEERRAARAAEAAKDRLIATVSHELRNPLSPALIAASAMMQIRELPKLARDMSAVIKRNIELEARLIDDLLDVARATRGQLDLRLQDADVHEVILRALESCGEAAHSKGVTIDVNLTAEHHHARADEARLQQVFWNLLHNAIKFSPEGARVAVRTTSSECSVLTVSVRDFGPGMDEATLQKLFSPFEQPRAPSAGRAGLGLGLTIARNIVELHHGRIWARSDGSGSVFEVELATIQPPADSDAPMPWSRLDATTAGGRVLIVEDNADTGMLLSRFLTTHGYEVTLARSLAEGLTALERRWDAVLSDIGLGDGSGLEIARRTRRLDQQPEHLVALSGYGTDSDRAASREAGFDTHLVKPVDLEELLALLDSSSDASPPDHVASG